ncbi:hypothetical protein TWF481_011640 [Arthrobotrys musiformis]|uniref:Uncharacterized protein n=1 Tax=Arthrobotrys musiformis TaxID=47236 RepID=A0AAV9W1U8_9PEZI
MEDVEDEWDVSLIDPALRPTGPPRYTIPPRAHGLMPPQPPPGQPYYPRMEFYDDDWFYKRSYIQAGRDRRRYSPPSQEQKSEDQEEDLYKAPATMQGEPVSSPAPAPAPPAPPAPTPVSVPARARSAATGSRRATPNSNNKIYTHEEDNFVIWAAGEENITSIKRKGKTEDYIWNQITKTMRLWLQYKYPGIADKVPPRSGRTLKEHWSRPREGQGPLIVRWQDDPNNVWVTQQRHINDRQEMTTWYDSL